MIHRHRLALALAALLLAAPAARGQDQPPAPAPAAPPTGLVLTLDAAPAEVPVSGPDGRVNAVKLTFRLRNEGSEPRELYRLAEDQQLLSFDVQLEGSERVFTCERIHPSPYAPRTDWPRATLAPGEQWELELELPALTTGRYTVTGHYGRKPAVGLAAPPPHLVSKPASFTVVPDAAGNDAALVELVTTMGPIRLRLFPRDAFNTALSFARLVGQDPDGAGPKTSFYEGLTFHRIILGFMIQGGDPKGTGEGGPDWSIPAEFAKEPIPAHLRHAPGRLSMARSGHVDSAGSQFFICVGRPSHLDGQYTCFGEVVRGLDVAFTIGEMATGENDRPLREVKIVSARLRPGKAPRPRVEAPEGEKPAEGEKPTEGEKPAEGEGPPGGGDPVIQPEHSDQPR